MISQPPYVWYHIQYTCDILSTIFMTSYPLCKTTQHGVVLIPHSACVWHHLHYRWYNFHANTPNQFLWCHIYYRHGITPSLLDIAPIVSLSSQPLHWYHTHFLWHLTHYVDDVICTLHNIMSTPYVITLLYFCHHSLYIWNHIQYVGPHIHYTCDITATNLCHHSHSIEIITHALYDIRLG